MNLSIAGKPGSGKSTQARIISKRLKILHVYSGNILRSQKGELSKKLKSYMDRGLFVPNKLMVELIKIRILKKDCKKGFILDGSPRNISQIRLINKIRKIDKIIEIYISDKEAIRRLSKRGRKDDSSKVIKERLNIYSKNTLPVLRYYKKQKKVIKIDGSQSIKKIAKDIEKALGV